VKLLNYQQKLEAALNPNTTPEILEQLATDQHYYVRAHVAENPNTPQKTLELLATDEDWYVRSCVANNLNITPETLQQLATDRSCFVRDLVTENPNRTELIERLVLMTDYQLSTQPQNPRPDLLSLKGVKNPLDSVLT
jgi:3-methyladenine DNA glycosylase AlkC